MRRRVIGAIEFATLLTASYLWGWWGLLVMPFLFLAHTLLVGWGED